MLGDVLLGVSVAQSEVIRREDVVAEQDMAGAHIQSNCRYPESTRSYLKNVSTVLPVLLSLGIIYPRHSMYAIPGSSFGRKKVPDLNPAKFCAGFRKKRRRPKKHPDPRFCKTEMIKGWIIHKEAAFAPRIVFLEHTHSTAQHWGLPVPIALAHLPNGLRAEPSQNRQLVPCAQAKASKKKPRSMWQGTPLSLQPCL